MEANFKVCARDVVGLPLLKSTRQHVCTAALPGPRQATLKEFQLSTQA
jgi:hypothetical protein